MNFNGIISNRINLKLNQFQLDSNSTRTNSQSNQIQVEPSSNKYVNILSYFSVQMSYSISVNMRSRCETKRCNIAMFRISGWSPMAKASYVSSTWSARCTPCTLLIFVLLTHVHKLPTTPPLQHCSTTSHTSTDALTMKEPMQAGPWAEIGGRCRARGWRTPSYTSSTRRAQWVALSWSNRSFPHGSSPTHRISVSLMGSGSRRS